MTTEAKTDVVVEARELAIAMCKAPLAGYTAAIWPRVPDLLRSLCDEVEKYRELFRAEREAHNADAADIRSSIVSLIEAKAGEWGSQADKAVIGTYEDERYPLLQKAAAARELAKLIGEMK